MSEQMMARLFAAIALLVTVVWLIGYLAPIWRPGYTPAPELNIVMMAIVGIFVSLYQKAAHAGDRKPKDKDKDRDKDDEKDAE